MNIISTADEEYLSAQLNYYNTHAMIICRSIDKEIETTTVFSHLTSMINDISRLLGRLEAMTGRHRHKNLTSECTGKISKVVGSHIAMLAIYSGPTPDKETSKDHQAYYHTHWGRVRESLFKNFSPPMAGVHLKLMADSLHRVFGFIEARTAPHTRENIASNCASQVGKILDSYIIKILAN